MVSPCRWSKETGFGFFLLLTCYETLEKLLNLLNLSYLICKMELYLAFYLRHSRCLIKDNNIIINTIIHLKKVFIFKTHLFCEHFSYSSSTQNCVLLIFPITSCYSFIIRLIIALYSSFFFGLFFSLRLMS